MYNKKSILVTGGAGFIGSHLVKHWVRKYPEDTVVNLDALTYAGNLENLVEIEKLPNYRFVRGDIRDLSLVQSLFDTYNFDAVLHCAAESHVDRSINDPLLFIQTNVLGTATLLYVCKQHWKNNALSGKRFLHISTDEVYGSLGPKGYFTESTAYDPRSPYSASKAGSDHMAKAYYHTYGLPVIISNCSNNYGPYQFPEKLIPLCIANILKSKEIPVYGDGLNIRDWLYVQDHIEALDLILHQGTPGETYNIGGDNEWTNIDLVKAICRIMDEKTGRPSGTSEKLIKFVQDRAGHDKRYAIDASKIKSTLGWRPIENFSTGLNKTVDWYLNNKEWLERVISGSYQTYYERQYGNK